MITTPTKLVSPAAGCKPLRDRAKKYAKNRCKDKTVLPSEYSPSWERWSALCYNSEGLNGADLVLAFEAGFRAALR